MSEIVLLDSEKRLKIADFGVAVVFQSPNDPDPAPRVSGVVGTQGYIPYEVFQKVPYDPRAVDIFSCGLIYIYMIFYELPWKEATMKDAAYRAFHRNPQLGFALLNRLDRGIALLIWKMVHPRPRLRITAENVLASPQFQEMEKSITFQQDTEKAFHAKVESEETLVSQQETDTWIS